jgi:preprotein translocase subunit SecA
MDLSAVESIDIIRQAFQKNRVTISIPSDLEDVEINLGLRMHRETPRPDYGMELEDFDDEDEYEPTIIRQEPKIGRNYPCPCGSGKKYKKCCLK